MKKAEFEKKAGFTMLELLVVITILAIIVGAMVSGYGRAQKAAWASRSQSLALQTATAWNSYLMDNQVWPKNLDESMTVNMCKIIGGAEGRRRYMDLAYEGSRAAENSKGRGEALYGLLDAWGQIRIKQGRTTGLDDFRIQVRFDENYDGVIDSSEGSPTGESIRATVIAWSWGNPDGKTGFVKAGSDYTKLKTKSWVSDVK